MPCRWHSPRQQTLLVHCLKHAPTDLDAGQHPDHGRRKHHRNHREWIGVASVTALTRPRPTESAYLTALADAAKVLVIRTNVTGDFSPYTLRLVNSASAGRGRLLRPHRGARRVRSAAGGGAVLVQGGVRAGLRLRAASRRLPARACPRRRRSTTWPRTTARFRSIMLDRLNQLVPTGARASEADMGVALAELVAYVGDQLSYQQDAVATEAYLRNGAQPHLAAPPCAAGRLPRARRLQCARMDHSSQVSHAGLPRSHGDALLHLSRRACRPRSRSARAMKKPRCWPA